MLEEQPWDRVLHLAALASVQNSSRDALAVYQVNLMGTLHLLEALSEVGWKGRFLLVSSAAVYGHPDSLELPVRETSAPRATSPYAASKIAAEQAALEWGDRNGVDIMVARPANHTGAGQSDHYFLPSMARQMTAVGRGQTVRLAVGNLAPSRDFSHVSDVIDAYLALLDCGRAGSIYNVASGRAHSLATLLEGLALRSGRRVELVVDPERFRAEGERPFEISVERIHQDTGWSARRGLPELYSDLIDYWEKQP